MTTVFAPHINKITTFKSTVPVEDIELEPMFFSASIDFAERNGGPLTRKVLSKLKDRLPKIDDKHWWVIDTRSHMLMPGMYPAIGGWHCDAVKRSMYDSQPDLNKIDDSRHYIMTLSSREEGVSHTEIITSELKLDVDPERVWADVSNQINANDLGNRMLMQDGDLYEISSTTIHRPTATIKRGWRWFFRCSCYYNPPQNRIRHQVQVYSDINGGW